MPSSSRSVQPRYEKENRMAFTYKLEHEEGTPADPPTLNAAVNWRAGDTIPLGREASPFPFGRRLNICRP
jgi:hypothetical protein